MEMNLRLLRYFVTVVDHGHFGKAAQSLHISAPALTKDVRRLEQTVGLTLLNRDSHPIRPTSEGEAFLVEARRVLDAAQRAVAVVHAQSRRRHHRLALGFVVTPLGRRSRQLIEAFAAEIGPDVLQLIELGLGDQLEAVADGRVDASLAWGPVADARLHIAPVLSAQRVLAVPVGHPLARASALSVTDLPDLPHIRMADDLVSEQWVRWWACDPRPDGSAVRYASPSRTIAEFLERAATGREIAITSALLAEAFMPHDLAFVPLVDVPPSEVFLCTRKGDDAPLLALLRMVLKQVVDQPR